MEASALRHQAALPNLVGRSPLLRLQSDEKLVALIRRGAPGAFEALVQRYQPRLLAFCRHMLCSQEDAEDVLQEVFAASFNALLADDRPINLRPWLYRIARNRCLNHLRKPRAAGQDSMDVFERDNGATTAETVHRREEFRHIVADVQDLPETQRTALLMREIDALSYDQIAEAMETTVPSVKSLLVRARVGLAEASEARLLTCAEVRLELGQVAEGLTKSSAPVRRHLKTCERCRTFRSRATQHLQGAGSGVPDGRTRDRQEAGAGQARLRQRRGRRLRRSRWRQRGRGRCRPGRRWRCHRGGSAAAGGAISAGIGAVTSKAAAGMAAAVHGDRRRGGGQAGGPGPGPAGAGRGSRPARPGGQARSRRHRPAARRPRRPRRPRPRSRSRPTKPVATPIPAAAPAPVPVPTPPPPAPVQEGESVATLPPRTEPLPTPVTQVPPADPLAAEPPPPTEPPATPLQPATPPPAATTPRPPAQPAPAPLP